MLVNLPLQTLIIWFFRHTRQREPNYVYFDDVEKKV